MPYVQFWYSRRVRYGRLYAPALAENYWFVTVTVTEALVLHPPTRRPRAHHRVHPYLGARRQNETEMFSDQDETSPSIAAVSAPSVACSMEGEKGKTSERSKSSKFVITPLLLSGHVRPTDVSTLSTFDSMAIGYRACKLFNIRFYATLCFNYFR